MHGEYTSDIVTDALTAGSPPLARGVLETAKIPINAVRITPACAGSTAVSIGSKCLSQDHPRLRGEYSPI